MIRARHEHRLARPTPEWLSLVLVLAVLVGCEEMTSPSSSFRALGAGEQWLRSIPPRGICAGGGATVTIRLHGSASDSRLAWMTLPSGTERQLSWAPGTSARFGPHLEVIGTDGTVIAREGSIVTGSCIISPDFLVPEFGGSLLAAPTMTVPAVR